MEETFYTIVILYQDGSTSQRHIEIRKSGGSREELEASALEYAKSLAAKLSRKFGVIRTDIRASNGPVHEK